MHGLLRLVINAHEAHLWPQTSPLSTRRLRKVMPRPSTSASISIESCSPPPPFSELASSNWASFGGRISSYNLLCFFFSPASEIAALFSHISWPAFRYGWIDSNWRVWALGLN